MSEIIMIWEHLKDPIIGWNIKMDLKRELWIGNLALDRPSDKLL
jgi:hypothetical protein